jgi:hypothetical protein
MTHYPRCGEPASRDVSRHPAMSPCSDAPRSGSPCPPRRPAVSGAARAARQAKVPPLACGGSGRAAGSCAAPAVATRCSPRTGHPRWDRASRCAARAQRRSARTARRPPAPPRGDRTAPPPPWMRGRRVWNQARGGLCGRSARSAAYGRVRPARPGAVPHAGLDWGPQPADSAPHRHTPGGCEPRGPQPAQAAAAGRGEEVRFAQLTAEDAAPLRVPNRRVPAMCVQPSRCRSPAPPTDQRAVAT